MGLRTTKRSISGHIDAAGRFSSFFRSKLIGTASNPPKDRGIQATGGTIREYVDDGFFWRAHVFTASGALTVEGIPGEFGSDVEYLVVAGGGGGGSPGYGGYGPLCPKPGVGAAYGGGGGAGGLRTNSTSISPSLPTGNPFPVSTATYPIIVGSGAAGGAQGTPSVFNNPGVEDSTKITSTGGGYGGNGIAGGGPGGSGGGAGGHCFVGGTAVSGQGTNGGNSGDGLNGASGGSILPGGVTSTFSGESITYSVGGGGGFYGNPQPWAPTWGNQGAGGGAYGPGPQNNNNDGSGRGGADGVVIIRYKISQ